MRVFAAVALALVLATTPTTAQVARSHELTWPAAPIGPLSANPLAANSVTVNALTANPPATRIPQPLEPPLERMEDAEFVSAILVTSMGSVAGLFAGALTGLALLDDSHGEFDAYSAAFVGSVIGTTFGAVVPAGLISDNWGRTVLGSLGGAIAGAMLGISVGEKFNGPMGVAVYGLTHGVFTVAAAR